MKKIDISLLIMGLLVFVPTSMFLASIENSIFWSVVMKFREASESNDSFQVAREYQVAINPKVLFYHFLFISISFGIASVVIAHCAKQNIIIHLLIFTICIEFFRKAYFLLRSPQEFFEFPFLIVAEVICAIAMCFLVGAATIKIKHITG